MKVLLSPLFPHSEFCPDCVRAFYREHPHGWTWEFEFSRMPPLG